MSQYLNIVTNTSQSLYRDNVNFFKLNLSKTQFLPLLNDNYSFVNYKYQPIRFETKATAKIRPTLSWLIKILLLVFHIWTRDVKINKIKISACFN